MNASRECARSHHCRQRVARSATRQALTSMLVPRACRLVQEVSIAERMMNFTAHSQAGRKVPLACVVANAFYRQIPETPTSGISGYA
jgi:hypothetical protein